MWQDHSAKVGISREEFDDYLDGSNSAYILEITKVQHLVPLLTLEQMRGSRFPATSRLQVHQRKYAEHPRG